MGQIEFRALTVLSMVSSFLKGDLSGASPCPSQDPNLKPKEGPFVDVIATKPTSQNPKLCH